jgi:hypothetical protein
MVSSIAAAANATPLDAELVPSSNRREPRFPAQGTCPGNQSETFSIGISPLLSSTSSIFTTFDNF